VTLTKGDIVLVLFPFTDLTQTKLRPGVVLWASETSPDVTLGFISSQNVNQLEVGEFKLDQTDPEFSQTGLKIASKVRLNRIATLERGLLQRRLGKLSTFQMQQLNSALKEIFQLN
jgi:mRNA interferase MazF